MITTRFNEKLVFYLFAASVASMMLSIFLLQLFAGLLSFLWLFEKLENKRKAVDLFTALILIFGGIRILSIIFSQYPSVSSQSYYKDALFYFSFFSMSYYLKVFDKKRLMQIIYVFVISASIVSLIGIIMFNLNIVDRAQSFSSGYATFSSFLLAALGMMITVIYADEKKYAWVLVPLGAGIMLTGIVTSLGRFNAFVALLLFVGGILLGKIKVKHAAIIIFVTFFLALISFFNNSSGVSQRVEHPGQLSDRNILYEGAAKIWSEHPVLGFGPRTFHNIFPYFDRLADKGIGSWHNDFVQVYFESGFAGLIVFIAIIITVLLKGIRFVRRKELDFISKNLVTGILLGFSALVLSAFLAGFIDSPVLSIVFVFLISLLSGEIYHTSAGKNPEAESA